MHLTISSKQSIQEKILQKVSEIEQARIKKHLRYTLKELQKTNVDQLAPEAKSARRQTLENLSYYIEQADFPINTRSFKRHPIFVDDYGNYCAVGYLLHVAGHDDIVDEIHQNNNLVRIDDVENSKYISAIASLGISMEEAAQIQPGYGFMDPYVEPAPEYSTTLSMVALVFYVLMQIFLLRFITKLNISNRQKSRLVMAHTAGNIAILTLFLMFLMAKVF